MSTSRKYGPSLDGIPVGGHIPSLPTEVLLSIISYIDNRQDLRNIRLSSQLLATLSEPRLFEAITLLPYRDFLQEFAACMKQNPRIAHHVQFLCYDVQYRFLDDIFEGSEEITQALHRNALTENNEEEELSLIAECLKVLPSLRTLRTIEVDFDDRAIGTTIAWSEYSYFRRLFGDKVMGLCLQDNLKRDKVTAAAQIVILALSRVSGPTMIRHLDIDCADVLNTFADVPEVYEVRMSRYRDFIGQLRSIYLTFATPSREDLQDWDYPADSRLTRENVGSLLTSAQLLEQLVFVGPEHSELIKFSGSVDHQNSWLAHMLRNDTGRIRQEVTFPNLKVLQLGNLICCESELTALIRLHRHKLEYLSLYNLYLVNDPNEPGHPCWVRTFKAIRDCSVRKVVILGEFSNLGSQSWFIGRDNVPVVPHAQVHGLDNDHWVRDRVTPEMSWALRSRMETWLTGKGAEVCPAQFAAVRLDENGDELIAESPSVLQKHVLPNDPTWEFRDLRDYHHGHWSDEESSMGGESWEANNGFTFEDSDEAGESEEEEEYDSPEEYYSAESNQDTEDAEDTGIVDTTA